MKPAAFSEAEIEAARRGCVGSVTDVDPVAAELAGRRCYVASVEPQAERRVLRELQAAAIAAWLPECRMRKPDRKRRIMVLGAPEPLFPGYLLVWLDLARDGDAAVLAVEGIDRVDRLLRRIGSPRPCPLPGAEVATLRRLIDQSGGELRIDCGAFKWVERRQKRPEICAPGDPVRVLDGPFTSFGGLYLHPTAEGRVKILLDLFGRSTPIELEEAQVEPLAELA